MHVNKHKDLKEVLIDKLKSYHLYAGLYMFIVLKMLGLGAWTSTLAERRG